MNGCQISLVSNIDQSKTHPQTISMKEHTKLLIDNIQRIIKELESPNQRIQEPTLDPSQQQG